MNGPHDMGAMQCYGAVQPEKDEPLFHGEWEKKAMALTVGMGFAGMWNLDYSRFMRESLPPTQYLSSSYYQIWISALEQLMLNENMVSKEELMDGKLREVGLPTKRVIPDEKQIVESLYKGGPVNRDVNHANKFSIGEQVKTFALNPKGHTRLPRYARGKIGTIVANHGAHVFPDSNAKGEGENPQYLYTVSFSANELFDEGDHEVMLDLFEPYLELANADH